MNRALLVGINAYPDAPLSGCVNDVTDMAGFLVAQCGFAEAGIRLLTDGRATTAAMLERLDWLVTGARSGDRLFFHFSGHGVQFPTRNPKGEVDGLDEVVCPVDFDWSDRKLVRDKDFVRIFRKVPAGVQFNWVSDSCHSGDLSRHPSPPRSRRIRRTIPLPADMAWRRRTARALHIEPLGLLRAAEHLNVALITGCRSDQTSADAWFGNRPNGALTYHLLRQLEAKTGLTTPLDKLLPKLRRALKSEGFDQIPQLEGHPTLTRRPFLPA